MKERELYRVTLRFVIEKTNCNGHLKIEIQFSLD